MAWGWTFQKLYLVSCLSKSMNSRIDKWTAKLRGSVRKQRYDAQKKEMCRKEKAATEKLVQIEMQVKQVTQGESILHIPYYIIFAKEIYKKASYHTHQTLVSEVEILQQKWIKRGLNWELLDRIKLLYAPPYKTGNFFRLDTSLLDGNDRLG